MKKQILFALLLSASLLSACGKPSETTMAPPEQQIAVTEKIITNADGTEQPILYTQTKSSAIDAVKTFQELVEHSEFIAEVKIREVSGFCREYGGMVYTTMVPEPIHVYRGGTNGLDALTIWGGSVPLMEYTNYQPEQYLELPSDMASPLGEMLFYSNVDDIYIPEAGDTLFYFGNYTDGSGIYMTGTYQGMFLCEGDVVTDQALEETEALTEDLLLMEGAELTEWKTLAETKAEKISIPKAIFEEALEKLCGK